jgi:hypothetical protein
MHPAAAAIGKIIGCIFGINIKGFASWEKVAWTLSGNIFCKSNTPDTLN